MHTQPIRTITQPLMPKDVTHSLGYIHPRTLTIVLQSLLQICRQAALQKAPHLSWTCLQGHSQVRRQ